MHLTVRWFVVGLLKQLVGANIGPFEKAIIFGAGGCDVDIYAANIVAIDTGPINRVDGL